MTLGRKKEKQKDGGNVHGKGLRNDKGIRKVECTL